MWVASEHLIYPGQRPLVGVGVQYDKYIVHEVAPFVRWLNQSPHLITLGCSFGGFHAVNTAFGRHPDVLQAVSNEGAL